MILSERELELGTDHSGIMVLPETEPGTPLGGRPAAHGHDPRRRAHRQPRRPALDLRDRARGRGALRPRARRDARPRAGAERRRAGRRAHRGLRRVPSLHRPHLRGRGGRPVAGLAARAADRGGDASDLERRRRDELRHARAWQPAARVRPHDARRGADRGAPGEARRDAAHPRRHAARAPGAGPRDRRRRAGSRSRGDHGRGGDRAAGDDHGGAARGGELRAV